MVETTNTLIDSTNRDLIISGGQFNFTHLQCHHTNITINIRSEDIHHNGRGSRSMRNNCFVSSSVITININDNASSPLHDPQFQVAHSGDIPQMSAAFMNNQKARVMQEMDSEVEFSGDNEEQNTFGSEVHNDNTSEDDMLVTVLIHESSSTVRAVKNSNHVINSLAGDHAEVDNDGPPSLTMEERVYSESSSRSVLIQESSSTAVRADKSPGHVINPGDHTEVDNDGPPSLTINQHRKKRKRKNDGPSHRTYRFDKCHVYMNSFNARGVRVKNSGNYAPVTHHSGAAFNEGSSSLQSSKSSRRKLSIRQSTRSTLRAVSSSYASIVSPSAPPVGIDIPFPKFEPDSTFGSPSPGPLPFQLRDDTVRPAITTLNGIETQPHPINPFSPMRMGLPPNFLSHILQPFPDDAPNKNTANDRSELPSSTILNPHQYPEAPDSSQHQPDATSNSLEYHLHSALAILLQTSGTLVDGVTPQARNTLKAINALVSTETPTRDSPFKVARKAFKWLQIPRSPK